MEKAHQQSKKHYISTYLGADAPDPSTSAVPTATALLVGQWVIHASLGMGARGLVSAASRRHGPAEVVACKEMLRRDARSAAGVSREIEAARFVTSLTATHPAKNHVIQLTEVVFQRGAEKFDGGASEKVWLFIHSLCRGTFRSHIINLRVPIDPPPYKIAVALFRQVLAGLDYLHSNNLVHRDIKPENIGVVTFSPPRAVILDVGLAIQLPQSKLLQAQPGHFGTVGYISPEMENTKYGSAADIWAAGVVGHELFVGRNPFAGERNIWRQDNNLPHQLQQSKALHADTLKTLSDKSGPSIPHLVRDMLTWSQDKQITANDALRHPSLAPDTPDDPGFADRPSKKIRLGEYLRRQ